MLYLASLGGKNITTLTNKIMKFLYTDNLATRFSFYGKRNNKKRFSECLLKTAVISKYLLLFLLTLILELGCAIFDQLFLFQLISICT